MDSSNWFRLAEKVIDNTPETIAALASLLTAKTFYDKNKKRQPKSSKRKR